MHERLASAEVIQPYLRLVSTEPVAVQQADLARGRETPDNAIVFPSFGKSLSEMNLAPAIEWFKNAQNGVLEYTIHPQDPTSYRLVGRELPAGITPGHYLADRFEDPQESELKRASGAQKRMDNLELFGLPNPSRPQDAQAALEADHPVPVVDFVVGENPEDDHIAYLLRMVHEAMQPQSQITDREHEIKKIQGTIFDTHDRTANAFSQDILLMARGENQINGSYSSQDESSMPYTMVLARKEAYGKDEIHAIVLPHAHQAQTVSSLSVS